MATTAGRLIQDENLNMHSTTGKADASKPTKKGALGGGRRALNNISNSGKPSGLVPSAKMKSTNVVPTGKDAGASKANSSKNQEKGKASGRKALNDLTNTVKKPPLQQHVSTKSQDKKLRVPSAIEKEGFLHNHEECLKAQRKAFMDFDDFLERVGLADGSSVVLKESLELEPESPPVEPEEIEVDESWQTEFLDSPRRYGNWKCLEMDEFLDSPRWYENWKDVDLKLKESPKALKF